MENGKKLKWNHWGKWILLVFGFFQKNTTVTDGISRKTDYLFSSMEVVKSCSTHFPPYRRREKEFPQNIWLNGENTKNITHHMPVLFENKLVITNRIHHFYLGYVYQYSVIFIEVPHIIRRMLEMECRSITWFNEKYWFNFHADDM